MNFNAHKAHLSILTVGYFDIKIAQITAVRRAVCLVWHIFLAMLIHLHKYTHLWMGFGDPTNMHIIISIKRFQCHVKIVYLALCLVIAYTKKWPAPLGSSKLSNFYAQKTTIATKKCLHRLTLNPQIFFIPYIWTCFGPSLSANNMMEESKLAYLISQTKTI